MENFYCLPEVIAEEKRCTACKLCNTTIRAKQFLILAATVAGAHTHDPGVSHHHDRIPGAIPGSRRLQLLLLLFDWGIQNW